MSHLIAFDQVLFRLINQSWTHPWLDEFFPVFTNLTNLPWFKYGVLPLILIIYLWRARWRALRVIAIGALLAAVCDLLSYRILKSFFERARPNHLPEMGSILRLPHFPQSFSFPSNHAVSMAALATFLSHYFPRLTWLWVTIAFLIGYSRVYVGVHFPTDVIGGWMIGWLVAMFFLKIVRHYAKKSEMSDD